nr:hypothetical protein [Tanacetum cinerariifolium]
MKRKNLTETESNIEARPLGIGSADQLHCNNVVGNRNREGRGGDMFQAIESTTTTYPIPPEQGTGIPLLSSKPESRETASRKTPGKKTAWGATKASKRKNYPNPLNSKSLGGLGKYGIITRARISLEPAVPMVKYGIHLHNKNTKLER